MKGQYQQNIFHRYCITQQHVVGFFGYVQGRKAEDSKLTHKAMAVEFIGVNSLDIDPCDLENRYYSFQKTMIELRSALNKIK